MIWKNVQYATHRMTFDPAQLQVEGEPRPTRYVGPEPGADERVRPRPHAARHRTRPAIRTWSCRRDSARATRRRSRRFCRVFPDMFYMEERGRNYFDTTKDRGRYLDAGFHSLMGYFRDDQPLYELILDEKQQASSTRCGSTWTSSRR